MQDEYPADEGVRLRRVCDAGLAAPASATRGGPGRCLAVCSCVRVVVARRTSAAVATGGRSTAAAAAPCGHAAKRSETPRGATREASAAGGCTLPEWAATGPDEKE